jgi:hypothetical protein
VPEGALADAAEPGRVGLVDEQVLAARATVELVLGGVVQLADLQAELRDLRFGDELALLAVVDAAHDGGAAESYP